MLRCVAVCCSVLQCVAVCVAVCVAGCVAMSANCHGLQNDLYTRACACV